MNVVATAFSVREINALRTQGGRWPTDVLRNRRQAQHIDIACNKGLQQVAHEQVRLGCEESLRHAMSVRGRGHVTVRRSPCRYDANSADLDMRAFVVQRIFLDPLW